ncbi:Serine/threonine protein kinase [Parasponia andersonii]|uniref:non-specific serine/threonine protein kinase n=1 Tax=Parasponia andersonii TaxID=3476 RepID=A0A2P5DC09_PARAD|nr:Serine/threonine protein kinase [Parasponia andersonii]
MYLDSTGHNDEQSILNELTLAGRFNNAEVIGRNDGKKGGHHDVKLFDFASLTAATNGFSTQNKLGEGGFGPVFKGVLPEGQEIAVKRLSKNSEQGLEEFKNELILIAKLQHMNLVRLLGCCLKKDERILIYEYMPNKSLDKFIFDPARRESLDWTTCYKIIEGIAQGLSYLHTYSRLPIIHRDLKPGNILLDIDMNPRISDFGMARIFDRDVSEIHTRKSAGTYGYMSPEYWLKGNFSEKSDVYSFGVILIEIVSGKKNSNLFNSEEYHMNLVGYAWKLWKERRTRDMIDSTLKDHESSRPQILRCIHVGLLCVQDKPMNRPTMSNVIQMIANEAMPLPDPKKPVAYFTGQNLNELNSSGRKEECYSVNGVTISEMEPR